ncbi:hypothetical protein [Streptomyces zingiberis]|uniref:Uncharacterized protein n=1 Tax=Streptomyces zingiberis TaxID=2053010 RepID=A0ABX1C4N7_9ACTN|nr:hypothetical protein [Streptomyces zingiberis]NJQ02892.1 hypothetical protein [Streptomyces zingiberis]
MATSSGAVPRGAGPSGIPPAGATTAITTAITVEAPITPPVATAVSGTGVAAAVRVATPSWWASALRPVPRGSAGSRPPGAAPRRRGGRRAITCALRHLAVAGVFGPGRYPGRRRGRRADPRALPAPPPRRPRGRPAVLLALPATAPAPGAHPADGGDR